jgi:hypothetical protein
MVLYSLDPEKNHADQQVQAEHWWLTSIILATWKAEIGRIMVRGQLGKTAGRPHLQNNQTKWTGAVAESIECLCCKCEALSSNTSPNKKIK